MHSCKWFEPIQQTPSQLKTNTLSYSVSSNTFLEQFPPSNTNLSSSTISPTTQFTRYLTTLSSHTSTRTLSNLLYPSRPLLPQADSFDIKGRNLIWAGWTWQSLSTPRIDAQGDISYLSSCSCSTWMGTTVGGRTFWVRKGRLVSSGKSAGWNGGRRQASITGKRKFILQLMRAVHIQKYGRLPVLKNCEIPQRTKGQYLLKMQYAPINPSDLFFYLGLYGIKKQGFPIMGFEGSAIIQDCDQPEFLGKKVSVFANLSNGTYAEYLVAKKEEILVWPQDSTLTLKEMSMCFVNPFSVLGMMDIIEEEQARSVVLSAATSNTSRMIMKCLQRSRKDIRVFGISRSPKYDAELAEAGFHKIYRMDQTQELKSELQDLGKTMFMDCVGGNHAGQVFNCLPPQSQMVSYGRLSKQNLGSVDLGELYYRDKRIRGFWLNNYLEGIGKQKLESLKQKIVGNCDLFRQKVRGVYPMGEFEKGTREAIKDQSEGKILLDLTQ